MTHDETSATQARQTKKDRAREKPTKFIQKKHAAQEKKVAKEGQPPNSNRKRRPQNPAARGDKVRDGKNLAAQDVKSKNDDG